MAQLAHQINPELTSLRSDIPALGALHKSLSSTVQSVMSDALTRTIALLQAINGDAQQALDNLNALGARAEGLYAQALKEGFQAIKNALTVRIKWRKRNMKDYLLVNATSYKEKRQVPKNVRDALLKVADDIKKAVQSIDSAIEQYEEAREEVTA